MNGNSRTREIEIGKHEAGVELADFLARRFTYQSIIQWKEHIAEGRVALNGVSRGGSCEMTGSARLREGDIVSFTPPEYEEPPVDTNWTLILEDDDFLFVNKPPRLPCHPAGIYFRNTLLELVRERFANQVADSPTISGAGDLRDAPISLHLVNRLDRETSGIVIIAKNAKAAAFGSQAMSGSAAEKDYLALVEGDFLAATENKCDGTRGSLEARGWLERDTGSAIRKKLRFAPDDQADGETAASAGRQFVHTTFFGAIPADPGLSLVSARLRTGKTHQIRATLQSLGFPIVGDKLYGRDPEIFLRFAEGAMTDADSEVLRMPHQALHCARLSLPSPRGGTYEIAAELPPSWITHS